MTFIRTELPDILIIELKKFTDERGWFMESYQQQRFYDGLKGLGLPLPAPFVQDNHSCSAKGVLRGLHYQRSPHTQGKLLRVTKGAIFDVAVDVRAGSPTLGQHVGMELRAEQNTLLWIPAGFAHGFIALEDDSELHYKTTSYYARECEAAILWNDADLAIPWPLQQSPILSAKDAAAPSFSCAPLIHV